ncbi:MAG: AAA family ATPase, partial [Myxococcota bacterium]
MLQRLRVQGFKSLCDVDVELAPLVVLLGPNASGKSNFLEALVLLSRLGTERTLADAFDVATRGRVHEAFSLPSGGLPALLEQDRAEMTLEADIESVGPVSGKPARHRYRLTTALHPASGELSVADEYLARLRKDGSPTQLPPRIERDRHDATEHLLIRQLGKAGRPLQEPLGLNHSLLSNQQFTGEKRYPDFEQLRSEFEGWRNYYLDPRTAMRQEEAPRQVTDIGTRGEHLAAFLNRLQEHPEHRARFLAVKRTLRAVIPTIEDLQVGLDKKRGTIDLDLVQDGVPFSSRVVSEGTLRALA